MGVPVVMIYKVLWYWGIPLVKNGRGRKDNGKTVIAMNDLSEPLVANGGDLNAEMEWLRFREQTLGPAAYSETPASKLFRKMKENPFVPIGAMATFGALTYGLWCMQQGRSRDSQIMMRARIVAQGFTVMALMSGVVIEGTRGMEKRLKSGK